jgi:chromosome segregation ATPase
MEKELEILVDKVERTALLVERLRADNTTLKNRLAAAEAERDRLRQHMNAARVKVEHLIGQLPGEGSS